MDNVEQLHVYIYRHLFVIVFNKEFRYSESIYRVSSNYHESDLDEIQVLEIESNSNTVTASVQPSGKKPRSKQPRDKEVATRSSGRVYNQQLPLTYVAANAHSENIEKFACE